MTEYKNPIVAVDVITFKYCKDNGLQIGLIKRSNMPFMGEYALPGVLLGEQETINEAIKRIENKTLVEYYSDNQQGTKQQLPFMDNPQRDDRGRVISLPHIVYVQDFHDKNNLEWFNIKELPQDLPFDHNKIINNALHYLSKNILSDGSLNYLINNIDITVPVIKNLVETGNLNVFNDGIFYNTNNPTQLTRVLDKYLIKSDDFVKNPFGGRPARIYLVK